MDTHSILSRNIRHLARSKGYSLSRLADFAGLSAASLSRIVSRKRSPTVRTLEKIALALETRVVDLLVD